MRIILAGGSGFLGAILAADLARGGHEIVTLTRNTSGRPATPRVRFETWAPNGQTGPWAASIEGSDAVVNLAGESIAAKRWSAAQKRRILDSRLLATQSLSSAIRQATKKPRVFVSGSAVGYYGDRGDETLTETSSPGGDFLAGVCKEWEAAAAAVRDLTRVVHIRTGVVLDKHGGALPKMLAPFNFFVGGPVGSGTQYMPWIHLDDWTRLVSWAITDAGPHGALNATAPNPVTNKEFSAALGHALRRPSALTAPAFALRMALGEMADALLLSSQRALPVRAADSGFAFRFTTIDEAFEDIFARG